jgi:hypothetical protein
MRDGAGAERGRWNFHAARVSKWIGPDLLRTTGDGVAVRLLELTCDSIDDA